MGVCDRHPSPQSVAPGSQALPSPQEVAQAWNCAGYKLLTALALSALESQGGFFPILWETAASYTSFAVRVCVCIVLSFP